MKFLMLTLSFCLVLAACHRKEFKTYTGTYQGNEGNLNWNLGETKEYIITSDKTLDVVKDGKYINVATEKIHINDIEPGKEYYSGTPERYFTLLFSDNKVYFFSAINQPESQVHYSFIGTKID